MLDCFKFCGIHVLAENAVMGLPDTKLAIIPGVGKRLYLDTIP